MTEILNIVTRKSELAIWQANFVAKALLQHHPQLKINILGVTTTGDKYLGTPLTAIGGKGLFVTELEQQLLNNKADIAVHSMKDVPIDLPLELGIGAILPREDARDVLVSLQPYNISNLPPGAIIGTASLRRQCQLLLQRKDLIITPLRGNITTRLNKLTKQKLNAIVLAAAGLKRLNITSYYQNYLDPVNIMLPAIGQGAIGIEYRLQDQRTQTLIAPLNDLITSACITAERAMNKKLNGGCQAPIAGYATYSGNILSLTGMVGTVNGDKIISAKHQGTIEQATAIGQLVAEKLLENGAYGILHAN